MSINTSIIIFKNQDDVIFTSFSYQELSNGTLNIPEAHVVLYLFFF